MLTHSFAHPLQREISVTYFGSTLDTRNALSVYQYKGTISQGIKNFQKTETFDVPVESQRDLCVPVRAP